MADAATIDTREKGPPQVIDLVRDSDVEVCVIRRLCSTYQLTLLRFARSVQCPNRLRKRWPERSRRMSQNSEICVAECCCIGIFMQEISWILHAMSASCSVPSRVQVCLTERWQQYRNAMREDLKHAERLLEVLQAENE